MDQPTADTFDPAAWMFASYELCKREQIAPNRLAYNKSSGTLAVFVKQSRRGDDFALSGGGLTYLRKRLEQGEGKDGSPVRAAIVVLNDVNDKPVRQHTAEELRDRFKGVEPYHGKFGPYWWIPAVVVDDAVF